MNRGKYIVVEGGEGAGKDTQIELLRQHFGEEKFVYTREPGGTPLGKEIRGMLLHGTHGEVALPAELFLFLADRAQHVDQVVRPALESGKIVVSNRSWISFLAYQIHGRGQFDWEPILKASLEKIFLDCPVNLALILDVPYEVGTERMHQMGKKLDIMESMPRESHERIRQAFLTIASSIPEAKVIDASRPVGEVWKDVESAVQSTL